MAKSTSSFSTPNSRYSYGGITEESKSFIEWWERIKLPKDVSDKYYVMERKYQGRPDLLATVMYGDPSLSWVILSYNNILDPIEELVEGTILRIPTLERVKSVLMNGQISSVPSTRNK